MISVPKVVKDLYHQDHAYKNIRIHFPNGERSDICNDLIVKDSVSFKESLCSQNTLKFGLCEASVFECETVGVGNIKGATIEVFVEIECPANIYGAEWRVDIQKNVYSIPYGIFIIDSCKRQSDMNHRKIQAYSYGNIDDAKAKPQIIRDGFLRVIKCNNYEDAKNLTRMPEGNDYIFSYAKRIINKNGMFPLDSFNILDTKDITYRNELSQFESYNFNIDFNETYQTSMARVSFLTYAEHFPIYANNYGADNLNDNNLYYVSLKKALFNEQTLYEEIKNVIEGNIEYIGGADYLPEALEYVEDFAMNKFIKKTDTRTLTSILSASINTIIRQDSSSMFSRTVSSFESPFIYKFNNSETEAITLNSSVGLIIPYRVDVFLSYYNHQYQPIGRITIPIDIRDNTVSQGKIRVLDVDFDEFLGSDKRIFQSVSDGYSHPTIYTGYFSQTMFDDFRTYLSALCELQGKFGKFDRFKKFFYVDLRRQFGLTPESELYPDVNVFPQGVTGGKLLPADYQTCWYEDNYTERYGAISCTYKNLDNVQKDFVFYFVGFDERTDKNTYNTYDISKNEIINKTICTEQQIIDVCQRIFEAIAGVQYMPVDFTGRGLPYVEAGDTFEILTKSNDSITTIVLNRTITGEQTLKDSYKSV